LEKDKEEQQDCMVMPYHNDTILPLHKLRLVNTTNVNIIIIIKGLFFDSRPLNNNNNNVSPLQG
jgi:hypothetical protein